MRRKRDTLRYSDTTWLQSLPQGKVRFVEWTGAIARSLGLLCMVLALAGPRWPDYRTRIKTEGIAIVMLVDVSGSMAERDFQWESRLISRMEAVKRAFRLFVEGGAAEDANLEGRPNDQIGLVAFATRPETVCPLTLSHSVLAQMLDSQKPKSIPGEMETNISDAIVLAMHRLEAAGSQRKVIILLSDGEHNVANTQSGWTPRQAAQVAAQMKIPIYAIHAGGNAELSEGGGLEKDSAASRIQGIHTLEDVAHITQGRSFQAQDGRQLLSVYQEIDKLEREEIESFQYRRYYEGYPWFGLSAVVLFGMIRLLELTLWQRLP
jgi:Ca-activated chloride channel family protein